MGEAPPRPLRTDFDRSIRFLVTALANKLSASASRRLKADLGLGLMEWRVIALLGVEEEASPGRVGQVAGVDKSVVSRAVRSLERRGLIAVSSEGQVGRQTQLRLTESGRALHDRGVIHALAAEQRLIAGFSAEEREMLIGFLKRLTANLPRLDAAD